MDGPADAPCEHFGHARPIGTRLLDRTNFDLCELALVAQGVQVVCPLLHHSSALLKVLGAVVCSAIWILDRVSQLCLYHQRITLQTLGQQGSCRCPEAVPGLKLRRVAEANQRSTYGILGNRPVMVALSGKHQAPMPGQPVQVSRRSTACFGSGTRCGSPCSFASFSRFIRAGGIVHKRCSRSISDHAAARSSPGRWNNIGAS
jgi:hypothetical protein